MYGVTCTAAVPSHVGPHLPLNLSPSYGGSTAVMPWPSDGAVEKASTAGPNNAAGIFLPITDYRCVRIALAHYHSATFDVCPVSPHRVFLASCGPPPSTVLMFDIHDPATSRLGTCKPLFTQARSAVLPFRDHRPKNRPKNMPKKLRAAPCARPVHI